MALDRAIIEGKLDIIDRNLKFLQDVQRLTEEKFLASYKTYRPQSTPS